MWHFQKATYPLFRTITWFMLSSACFPSSLVWKKRISVLAGTLLQNHLRASWSIWQNCQLFVITSHLDVAPHPTELLEQIWQVFPTPQNWTYWCQLQWWFQLSKLNFSRTRLGVLIQPSLFSFSNWGLHLSEAQSNNFPLKFHLKPGCWDQLLQSLTWMGKFCLKAIWFWLFCCWEQPEISLTNTKPEGVESNWDFCISFGLCLVLLCYIQISHVHALRNSTVGPL